MRKDTKDIGDYSPWGTIDHVQNISPGVQFVSTPGHGGIKLNRQTNSLIPKIFRRPGGWYEEDCEAAIPLTFIPEIPDPNALTTLKSWFPYEYEQHFNVTLNPGESYIKDKDIFDKENVNNFVVKAAWGSWHNDVPDGFVGVVARKASTNEEQYFLIPADEYNNRNIGFVIKDYHQQTKAIA